MEPASFPVTRPLVHLSPGIKEWCTTARSACSAGTDGAATPGFWRTNLVLAAIYGQLDEHEAARNALRSLLELRPGFAATSREDLAIWWEPDLAEHLIDGLRKAGLQIPARETGLHLTTTRKQVS